MLSPGQEQRGEVQPASAPVVSQAPAAEDPEDWERVSLRGVRRAIAVGEVPRDSMAMRAAVGASASRGNALAIWWTAER